jgi:hypothetical protein
VTYIPIPTGKGQNFAGLLTVDLPPTVVKGQEFNIIVRRITTRRDRQHDVAVKVAEDAVSDRKLMRNWRYVVGTFQVRIPVSTKEVVLFPEENTLAVLKWRLEAMSPLNRWYPVLKRYVSYVAARVDGLGGNSAEIKPSLQGVPVKWKAHGEKEIEYTGKVSAIIYDRFGDFEGFVLDTKSGDHRFDSREREIEKIVTRAWVERIVTSVFVEIDAPRRPEAIILRWPPKPFQQ